VGQRRANVHGFGERRQGDPGRVLALIAPDDDVDQILGGRLERIDLDRTGCTWIP
jgi:hypothetical protein